jgi:hypothetical protein
VALTLNRFALVDWVQVGDPLILIGANGVDNVFWTDGLENSRTEGTVSTTAPDVSSMTAAEDDTEAGQYAEGTYSVYVTYYRDATSTYPAMESGASAATSVSIAATGPSDIDLTDVPTSSDAQVDDRRIYLLGGVLEKPFYVGAIGDNTTTTYHIDVATATLQGNAVMAEAGSYPKRRTLTDEDIPSTNEITIPRKGTGVGAKITQLRVHKQFLYVFYEDAVFRVSGTNLQTFRAEEAESKFGSSGGPGTVMSIGDHLYYLNRQIGPVKWSGAGGVTENDKIGLAIQDFWNRLDTNRLRRAVATYAQRRDEAIWYVTEGRYDRNNRRLVLDVMSTTFAVDHAECTSVGAVRNEVGETCPLEGNTLADVFQYDIGNGDGAYAGTRSGTPTTADGVSITTSGITLPDAADCQGRPVYTYDSNGELLQDLRLITRTSATAFRVNRPISGTVATWKIGSIPFRWESPPIALSEGQSLWEQLDIRYTPTTTAATLSTDIDDNPTSTASYANVGSVSTDDDGRARVVVCDTNGRAVRAEDASLRLRADEINNTLNVKEIVITGTPAGGL